MDTAFPQKFPFILDRNLAMANCTEDHVCTSCDKVVLGVYLKYYSGSFLVLFHLLLLYSVVCFLSVNRFD